MTIRLKLIFAIISITSSVFSQSADVLSQAEKDLQKGAYQQVVSNINDLISTNADIPEAYLIRARAFMALGWYEQAIEDFEKTLLQVPDNDTCLYLMAKTFCALNQFEKAEEYIDQALFLNPSASYYCFRANIYQLTDQYLKAIEDCRKSIEMDEKFAAAYALRSQIYLDHEHLHLAHQDVDQAIALDQKNGAYYLLKGKIYWKEKHLTKALSQLDKSLLLSPKNKLAHYYKSKVYVGLGEYLLAFRQMEQFLDAENSSLYAVEMGTILTSIGLPELQKHYGDKNTFDRERNVILFYLYHDKRSALIQYIEENRLYASELPYQALKGIVQLLQNKEQEASETLYNYMDKATEAHDYFYLAHLIQEFVQDQRWLQKAEWWVLSAIQYEDSYINNYLYAKILLQLGKHLKCMDVCKKAISLAKKENVMYEEVQKMINTIQNKMVDDIPPVITLVSPVSSRGVVLVSAEDTIHVIGKASDESGIKEVRINNNPAKTFHSGEFDGLIIQKDSITQITITAVDYFGNQEEQTYTIKNTQTKVKSSDVWEGNSYALIFACNEYEDWNTLVNPVKDAGALADELEQSFGFQTDVVLNPTKNQIILKLKDYVQKSYQPYDQLLIFFAGHGHYDDIFKEGYVVAKDSKMNDESKSSYISHSILRTYVNSIACKHILLTLDVCFGGTFDPELDRALSFGRSKNTIIDRREFIIRKLRFNTRKYISSGGKEYVSDGRPGQHSPFVKRWLEALRSYGGEDGILTIAELLSYLEIISPEPRTGTFGSNEPGSDFLFIHE